MEVKAADVVLCEFFFSDGKGAKERPVLVLKDNLPHDDFVGIPISSQLQAMQNDEVVLDSSKFKEGGIPRQSKLIIRKTFVISKSVVIKKYGSLKNNFFKECHECFCRYFNCSPS